MKKSDYDQVWEWVTGKATGRPNDLGHPLKCHCGVTGRGFHSRFGRYSDGLETHMVCETCGHEDTIAGLYWNHLSHKAGESKPIPSGQQLNDAFVYGVRDFGEPYRSMDRFSVTQLADGLPTPPLPAPTPGITVTRMPATAAVTNAADLEKQIATYLENLTWEVVQSLYGPDGTDTIEADKGEKLVLKPRDPDEYLKRQRDDNLRDIFG